MNDAEVPVRIVGPRDKDGLVSLFDAAGSPCHCRYWHFEGDKNAWLARCYVEVGENRRELEVDVERGAEAAMGLCALDIGAHGESIVGWLKVAPVTVMKKAYEQKLYRGLPCFEGDRAGVFLIGCALVHPAHRRRGLLRAMVRAAVALAPALGATSLEALPRRPRDPVSDEELWTGLASVFLDQGFEEVHTFEPYPVLRHPLRGEAPGGA